VWCSRNIVHQGGVNPAFVLACWIACGVSSTGSTFMSKKKKKNGAWRCTVQQVSRGNYSQCTPLHVSWVLAACIVGASCIEGWIMTGTLLLGLACWVSVVVWAVCGAAALLYCLYLGAVLARDGTWPEQYIVLRGTQRLQEAAPCRH
jgi:hypothetical protein